MQHPEPDPTNALPDPITKLALLLEEQGHATYWVGEGLSRAVDGKAPRQFSFVTSAQPEEIISSLPMAVPTRSQGLSFVVPSASGPIDLASLRPGETIEANLAERGFRVLAMAWRASTQEWIDPHEGQGDLVARRLRCIHEPSRDLARDPLRVLQAARLVADLALGVDPSLEAAMEEAYRDGSAGVPTCRLRNEIHRLLLCPDPSTGIELLRITRVDQQLGVGGREDAGPLMAVMPSDLTLRWTIWLRNAVGSRPLRKLRVDIDTAHAVQRLLTSHPIEERFPKRRGRTLRKRCEQIGEENYQKLIRLRTEELRAAEGEAAEVSRSALRKLAQDIEEETRQAEEERKRVDPVLRGEEIMKILDLPPGPQVGAALDFLRRHVADHPDENTPDHLIALLQEWSP